MNCRHCGARTRTLSTRHAHGGYVVKRQVECPNDHRYGTVEIDDRIWRSIVHQGALSRVDTLAANVARFKRNEAIRKARKAGALLKVIADDYALSIKTVSDICQHNR